MKKAFACKWDSITAPSMHKRVADFARRTAWELIVPACLFMLALCTMSRAEQEGRLDIKVRQMINEAMDDEVLDAPYAVEVNDRGDVYVADTANNRVIKYIGGDFSRPVYYPPQNAGADESDADVSTTVADEAGTDPKIISYAQTDTDRRLFKPMGVAFWEEHVYVADTGNGRVVVLRDDGDTLTYLWGFGYFVEMGVLRDIAAAGNGLFYLLDSRHGRIMKYDRLGNHIAFKENTPDITGLFNPYGITVDASGNIYVANTTHHRVIKYSPQGDRIMEFGEKGKGEGYLLYPQDVAVDNEGSIFVSDTENNRIMKYKPDGSYAGYFGQWGREPGEFFHNRKISFGLKDGLLLLYAVDTSLWRIQVIEVTPFINIVHEPLKAIVENPFQMAADVTTLLEEPITVKTKYKVDEGVWQYATMEDEPPPRFLGQVAIPGLETNQIVTYRIEATSQSESTTNFTEYFEVTVDLDPPVIINTQPENYSYINAQPLELSAEYYDKGLGVDTSAIRLSSGATILTPSQVTGTRMAYSVSSTALPEAEHQITLAVPDKAGHESDYTWHIIVDRTMPQASISEIRPVDFAGTGLKYNNSGAPIAAGRMEIRGLVSDANISHYIIETGMGAAPAVWSLTAHVGTSQNINGPLYYWDTKEHQDGIMTLRLTAVDKAGNQSAPARITVVIDNTRPQAAVTNPFFSQVIQPLSLIGGTTEVKAVISEPHLTSYKLESAMLYLPDLQTQCGTSGQSGGQTAWTILKQETFAQQQNAQPLDLSAVWRVSGIEPNSTEIYTLRLTASDAYQTYSYCSMFNVGLEGIVITPIPGTNMPTNKLAYDLSDAGKVTVQIFRVKDASRMTSIEAFANKGWADFTKTIVAGKDQPRGLNEVVWDGRNAAGNEVPDSSNSNVYFYVISATNDGGTTTYAFGRITKQKLPRFTSWNMSTTSSDISFIINKQVASLQIEIYNSAGNLVNSFDSARYLYGNPTLGYVYYLGWGGTNKYGRQVEYGSYTVRLKATDTSGNKAEQTFSAMTGFKPPVIAATNPSRKRTDPVKLQNSLPQQYQYHDPGRKIATASSRSATNAEIAAIENVASPQGIAAIKVLSITKYHELAVNNSTQTIPFVWNGISTNPENQTSKTSHPLGRYDFYIFDQNNQWIGFSQHVLDADNTAANWSSTQDDSTGDYAVTLWSNEFVKNYVLSVYDGDGNVLDIQSKTNNEDTWSGTAALPLRSWKQTWNQLVWTSAGRFPHVATNMLRFKLMSEDVAGNVNTVTVEVKKDNVPFTEDTGAVIISEDRKGMLRIPPYSVTSGQSYNSFDIVMRSPSEFPPLPSGVVFLDRIYNFIPEGATFSSERPAQLRLYYDVDSMGNVLLNGIVQGPEERIAFYYFNEPEQSWERIAGAVGIENYGQPGERHYIWAPMLHLSNYCLGIEKDTIKPVAEITAPSKQVVGRETYSIVGTAYDANIAGYTLSYAVLESGKKFQPSTWIVIKQGTSSVQKGVLGVWDLRQLQGDYVLKLTVWDNAGNTTSVQKAYKTQGGDPPGVVLSGVQFSPQYIAPASSTSTLKRITLSYNIRFEGYGTIDVVNDSGTIIKSLSSDVFEFPGNHVQRYTGDTNDGAIAQDGPAHFRIVFFDRDRNRTEYRTGDFLIDSTSPLFSDYTPSANEMVLENRPVISVRISDGTGSGLSISTLSVSFNGSTVSGYSFIDGLLTFTATSDTLDVNTVEVSVRDRAGNLGTGVWQFRGDRTPPELLSITEVFSPFSPTESMDRKDVCKITANVTEPHGFDWTLEIKDQGGETLQTRGGEFEPDESGGPFTIHDQWYGNKKWYNEYDEILVSVMPDGEYPYSLRLTDKLGNESVYQGMIEKDDTVPVVDGFSHDFSFFSPFESPLMNDSVTFNANVSELNPERLVWLVQNKNDVEVFRDEIAFDGSPMVSASRQFTWNGLQANAEQAPDDFYGISLVIYDEAGNFTIKTGIVGLDNTKPVAHPGEDITVPENSEVLFDATDSTDNLSGISSYSWDLDGNGTFETSGATATLVFSDDGVFNVSLKIVDNAGNDDIETRRVTVVNEGPVVFAGEDRSVQYSDFLAFTGSYTDTNPADQHTVEWNFGDGSELVHALNAQHAYLTAAGDYTAVLTVTDDDGGKGQDSIVVTVQKEDTAISYTGDTSVRQGETAVLRAVISETDDEPGDLSNRLVTWTIGAQSVSSMTDDYGYAEATLLLSQAAGNYTVVARMNEDGNYLASEDAQSFIVEAATVDIHVTWLSPIPGSKYGDVEPIPLRFMVTDDENNIISPSNLDSLVGTVRDTSEPIASFSPISLDILNAISMGQWTYDITTGIYQYDVIGFCLGDNFNPGDTIEFEISAHQSLAGGLQGQAAASTNVIVVPVDISVAAEPKEPGPLFTNTGAQVSLSATIMREGTVLPNVPISFEVGSLWGNGYSTGFPNVSISQSQTTTDAFGMATATATLEQGSSPGAFELVTRSVCNEETRLLFDVERQNYCHRPACPAAPVRPSQSINCNPPTTGTWTITDPEIVCIYDPNNPSVDLASVSIIVKDGVHLTLMGFPAIMSIRNDGSGSAINVFDSTIKGGGSIYLYGSAVSVFDNVRFEVPLSTRTDTLTLVNNSEFANVPGEVLEFRQNSQACIENSAVNSTSGNQVRFYENAIVSFSKVDINAYTWATLSDNSIASLYNTSMPHNDSSIIMQQNTKACILDGSHVNTVRLNDRYTTSGKKDVLDVQDSEVIKLIHTLYGSSLTTNEFNDNPGYPFDYEYASKQSDGTDASQMRFVNSILGRTHQGGFIIQTQQDAVYNDYNSKISGLDARANSRIDMVGSQFLGEFNGLYLWDDAELSLKDVVLQADLFAGGSVFSGTTRSVFDNVSCGVNPITITIFDNHEMSLSNSAFNCDLLLGGSDISQAETLIDLNNNSMLRTLRFYSYKPGATSQYENSNATVYVSNTQIGDNAAIGGLDGGVNFAQFGKAELISQEFNDPTLPDVDYIPDVNISNLWIWGNPVCSGGTMKGPFNINKLTWQDQNCDPIQRVFPTYVHTASSDPLPGETVCLVQDSSNPQCIAGTESITDSDGQAEPSFSYSYASREQRFTVCAPGKGECDYNNLASGVGIGYGAQVAIDPIVDTFDGPVAISTPSQGDIVDNPTPIISGQSEFEGKMVEIYMGEESSGEDVQSEYQAPMPPHVMIGFTEPHFNRSRIIKTNNMRQVEAYSMTLSPIEFQGMNFIGDSNSILFIDGKGSQYIVASGTEELFNEGGDSAMLNISFGEPINLALIRNRSNSHRNTVYTPLSYKSLDHALNDRATQEWNIEYYQHSILVFHDGEYHYQPATDMDMPFAESEANRTVPVDDRGFIAYQDTANIDPAEPDYSQVKLDKSIVYVATSSVPVQIALSMTMQGQEPVLIATGTVSSTGSFDAASIDLGDDGDKVIYAVIEDAKGIKHKSQKRQFRLERKLKRPHVYTYPEPFIAHQGTAIFIDSGKQPDAITISIVNAEGEIVRTFTQEDPEIINRIWWDGKDTNGQYVGRGTYTIEVAETFADKINKHRVEVEVEGGGQR